jgi:hypothetical protein
VETGKTAIMMVNVMGFSIKVLDYPISNTLSYKVVTEEWVCHVYFNVRNGTLEGMYGTAAHGSALLVSTYFSFMSLSILGWMEFTSYIENKATNEAIWRKVENLSKGLMQLTISWWSLGKNKRKRHMVIVMRKTDLIAFRLM